MEAGSEKLEYMKVKIQEQSKKAITTDECRVIRLTSDGHMLSRPLALHQEQRG